MANERISTRRFKALLAEAGLTQAELAKKIGMDACTLNKKLRGNAIFRQNEMMNIVNVMNLSDNDTLVIFFPESCIGQQYAQARTLEEAQEKKR